MPDKVDTTEFAQKVKTACRVKATVFNDEVEDIIDECKADLSLAGVKKTDENDPLVRRAIIFYAKAHFGFNNDSERFVKAYEHLKCALCLAGDYIEVE